MSGEELVLVFFVFGGGFWVIRPLMSALAKRLVREGAPAVDPRERDAIPEELQRLRQELGELAERVDFAERLLAKGRDAERLAPPR